MSWVLAERILDKLFTLFIVKRIEIFQKKPIWINPFESLAMPVQLKMWINKIRLPEKPDWYKAHLDPNINQKEIMFIGKLVFLFKMSILQERKLWIWVQARCPLLPSFSILAICAIWQILRVFQLNFCSTLLRKISSNHLWILQGISKQNVFF